MDERLRALERAWTQSREEGDELRLVRERLRTGALRLAHLEVGAFLGSPVAQELTPVILVSPGVRFGSREWSVALYRRFGPHLTRRFELGLLRSFLPTWRRLTPNDDLFPRLLDRMGRYLLDPTQRAALAQVLDEDPSEVEAELRLSRCRERRFNGNVEVNVGAFLLPPTQQHRRLLGDLICNCPDHIALTLAHSYAERQLLEPPLEPADYGGSALLEAMRSPRVSYQHDFDQALARATQELLNWCLGHEEPFGPKRKLLLSPTPNPAPSLEVSQEHLLQLERAAEQTPADLETLRELVRASEAAGWRHGRYTMQDYRKLLRIAGTRAEDTATGRTVASLGLRAVPLALDALPSPVACRALQHLGERALAAVPRLVELLSHPESEVRRDSVRVLEAIGPSHALEPVRRALGQKDKRGNEGPTACGRQKMACGVGEVRSA